MEQITDTPKRPHHGRNIKRIREFFGVKQEAMAKRLGSDWSQGRVSVLEDKEIIEPEILALAAKALNVTTSVLEHTTEEMAANFFNNNNFYDQSFNQNGNHNSVSVNPIEELIKSFNDYKALNEKNVQLYDELLRVEREKVLLLEKLLITNKQSPL